MNSNLKFLVIGGGGREHAICWKLKQSSRVEKVYCAPGNAGIAGETELLNVPVTGDFAQLIALVKQLGIDYTFVGPEAPLSDGIVDAFEAAGLQIFGPCQAAALLEGSKSFAKDVMIAAGVPTAQAQSFTEVEPALKFTKSLGIPVVVKADGLAAGKGVVVARSFEEAEEAIRANLEDKQFGDSSACVLIEEFLQGEEVSMLAFTDGTTILPMATAQDHKALLNGDMGPNTGGMGAYSPAPVLPDSRIAEIHELTLAPIVKELSKRGIRYRGVLYAGLMMTANGPKVLEYNCRFGDPETQCVLARLDTDLAEVVEVVCAGTLNTMTLQWKPDPAVCVVMAAEHYPDTPRKGDVIRGLEIADNAYTKVFHAGTKFNENGHVITAGGRVLGITAWAPSLPLAIARAYEAVEKIHWDGAQYRTDIGHKALKRG